MEADIVAALDAALAGDEPLVMVTRRRLQQARDEIAALRWMLTHWDGHRVDLEPALEQAKGV